MNFSKILHRFTVTPSLPKELAGLQRIAYNLWWCWEPDAIELFTRLDPELWRETRHNPVEMLGMLQQATLEVLKADEASFRIWPWLRISSRSIWRQKPGTATPPGR